MIKYIFLPLSRLCMLAILFAVGLKLLGLLLATLFSFIVSLASAYFLLNKKFLARQKELRPRHNIGRVLRYSNPLFWESLLVQLISAMPIFFLGYFQDSAAVGIYGVSFRIALLVSLPLMSFNLIFAPTISNLYGRGEKKSLEQLFKTVTKWIFTMSFALCLITLLFAKPILAIFGAEFVQGAMVLSLLAFGEFMNASVGSSGYILMMTGRPRMNLINSVILFAVTLILAIILIPRYGILGAALTTSSSISIINILRLVEVYYFEKIHPYNKHFAKPIVAGIVSGLLLWVLRSFVVPDGLVYLFFSVVLFGSIFIGSLFLLRFEHEDLLIIRSIGRKLKLS